jgi:hypothetical protein
VPVAVNYGYCVIIWLLYGYGKYPKHVEWSCNKIKIVVLHSAGHFMCIFIENNARIHKRKIY